MTRITTSLRPPHRSHSAAETKLEQLELRARTALQRSDSTPDTLRALSRELFNAGSRVERAKISARGLEVFGVVKPAPAIEALIGKLEAKARAAERRPGIETF